MPIVPKFINDAERIAWLRKHFFSKDQLHNVVSSWRATQLKCQLVIDHLGYAALVILTGLSGTQFILCLQEDSDTRINVLSDIQAGLGTTLLLVVLLAYLCCSPNIAEAKREAKEKNESIHPVGLSLIYFAVLVQTVLSTVQTIYAQSTSNAPAINILSYVQTGIGIVMLTAVACCKIVENRYKENIKEIDTNFTEDFFEKKGKTPDEIWADADFENLNSRLCCYL